MRSRAAFCLALLLLLPMLALARQHGEPRSWSLSDKQQASIPLQALPAIDPQALLDEDEFGASDAKGGAVLRFALPMPVSATPKASGRWLTLADGGRLWQARFHVPNATDINFSLARMQLPDGATVHFFSTRERYYQGPYTADDVQPHGRFWTPVLPGDEAVVELYLPPGEDNAEIALAAVNAGYRDLFGSKGSPLLKRGSCNVDVACPLGDLYRNEIRSVARYTINGSGLCTGTLMMDAAASFRPWLLTAAHCGITNEGVADSLVFYWNFQTSSCGGSGASLNQNQAGSTFRARRVDVDMGLVELDAMPPASFNVFYSGWDRSGVAPPSSIHIHHPNGDEKSISLNDDPLTTTNSCINTGGVNSHWDIDNYEQGTTEPGSSGSGVWTPAPNPRLIGFLSGGGASCTNLAAGDCYGKFSVAWDGSGASTRLSDWLGSGLASPPQTVEGRNRSGITLTLDPASISLCRGDNDNVAVSVTATGSSSPITLSTSNLPSGVTTSFSANPVSPPATPQLRINAGASATTGDFTLQVSGSGGGTTASTPLALAIQPSAPTLAVTPTSPAGDSQGVSLTPTFTWNAVAGATTYRLQVDNDSGFGSPAIDVDVGTTSHTPSVALQPGTSYWWRVTAANGCGSGPVPASSRFTTGAFLCRTTTAAIPDGNLTGVSQSMTLTGSGLVTDLDLSLRISHTWVGDLLAVLRHEASGTEVVVIDRPGRTSSGSGCSANDIDVVLDDEATVSAETLCATSGIAISGTARPNNPLSAFDDAALAGTWTLRVSDALNVDTGNLLGWCLLPATRAAPPTGQSFFHDGFEP